jgi:predicted nucleic acid-binding Zn ribbon protein
VAQPRKIGDVLAQLIARRGYAREQSSAALGGAWQEAAGQQFAAVTRAGAVRRGTLEVLVSNNLLAQELGFQHDQLIAKLQKLSPELKITKLRFRVAVVN